MNSVLFDDLSVVKEMTLKLPFDESFKLRFLDDFGRVCCWHRFDNPKLVHLTLFFNASPHDYNEMAYHLSGHKQKQFVASKYFDPNSSDHNA